MGLTPQNIRLISCESMTHISDIKLIRTDTTLDLSQKAEKGMKFLYVVSLFYSLLDPSFSHAKWMWDILSKATASLQVQSTDAPTPCSLFLFWLGYQRHARFSATSLTIMFYVTGYRLMFQNSTNFTWTFTEEIKEEETNSFTHYSKLNKLASYVYSKK